MLKTLFNAFNKQKVLKRITTNDICNNSFTKDEIRRYVNNNTGYEMTYDELEELQKGFITKCSSNFSLINNKSEKINRFAVNYNPELIKNIDNQTDELQLIAINRCGYTIRHIKNPTPNVQFLAVKQNYQHAFNIRNICEIAQMAAINEDIRAFNYINNPSERTKEHYEKLMKKFSSDI